MTAFLQSLWDRIVQFFDSYHIITDTLDIVLVALFIFFIVRLVRDSRAEQLIKGKLFGNLTMSVLHWLRMLIQWIVFHVMQSAKINMEEIGIIYGSKQTVNGGGFHPQFPLCANNCYYSLYLRRVRQLIVRFYEGEFPEFDMKHVTIDAAHILTLIDELHWRVYANVVYPG